MMKDEIAAVDMTQGSGGERVILHGRHICVLVVLLMTGISLGYQVRMPYEVRLGEAGDARYIEGFYEAESNPIDVYRWSGSRAVIRFPGIGYPQAATLRVRMNGVRPEGTPLPQVTVSANGRELAHLVAEGQMKIYEFPIPGHLAAGLGDIEIQLESETFSMPEGDLRELGVILDWVTVAPAHEGIVIPSPLSLVGVSVSAAIVCLPLRGRQIARRLALASALGLAIVVGLLFAFHRFQAALWSWRLALLVSVGYLGFIALESSRTLRGLRKRISKVAAAILFLAMIVHLLLLAPVFDEGPNVWTYKNWIWHGKAHGIQSLYLEPWAQRQPVYPPLSLYMFQALGRVYQSVGGSIPVPLEEPTPPLAFLIRLPGAICNVLIALAIYLWIQQRKGEKWAYMVMAAFAFNPAVVLISTRRGQMDSIHSLLVLLAVMSGMDRRPALSWALISLGAAVKPQALIFVPLLFVVTWRESPRAGVLTGVLAAASTTLVIMSPFIHSGTWQRVVKYFPTSYQYSLYSTQSTHDAYNLWWLLGAGKAFPATNTPGGLSLPLVEPVTYEVIGFLLFGMALLLALWSLLRRREGEWTWGVAAYVALAFFMLPTKIHVNYMYTVFPLLALGLCASKSLPAKYVVLSGTWLMNLVLQDPIVLGLIGPSSTGIVTSSMVGTARMLNAVANTIVLAWWTYLLMPVGNADSVKAGAGAEG